MRLCIGGCYCALNRTGSVNDSSNRASPLGLSFLKIIVPVGVDGDVNVTVALKGTNSVVIQLLSAVAMPRPMIVSLLSRTSIGKDASKYHSRAFPLIVSGLSITWFGTSEKISSDPSLPTGVLVAV